MGQSELAHLEVSRTVISITILTIINLLYFRSQISAYAKQKHV